MVTNLELYTEKQEVTSGTADIGFFEGSATYVVVPADDDHNMLEAHNFDGYTDLQEIFVPTGIWGIQDDAFIGCPNLKKVTIAHNESDCPDIGGKPWGAPATCEFVFDENAKPKG